MTVSRLSPSTSDEELERASGVDGLELLRIAQENQPGVFGLPDMANELRHVLRSDHARLVQDDGLRRKGKPPVVELPEETRERARFNPGLLLKLRGRFAGQGTAQDLAAFLLARLRHR